MNRKYNYFYKITNNINNHFYYGVHSTDNINDGYMGSGKRLRIAYEKYGMENFSKEILKFFKTQKEAYEYESEIVTESLTDLDACYNIKCGGYGGDVTKITVLDNDGKCLFINKNDERFVNGGLHGVTHGRCVVYNPMTNKNECVSVTDERYVNKEVRGVTLGKMPMKDKNGKCFLIQKKEGLNLGYKPLWEGKHHSQESKNKMSNTSKLRKNQVGEKNSQYGKKWVHIDNGGVIKNVSIKKEELNTYLQNGYVIGRYIPKRKEYPITREELEELSKTHKNKEICAILGVSVSTLKRWRRNIGA